MRFAALSLVLAAGLAGAALAQAPTPPATPGAKAAAVRHDNFKQLGGAFKAIVDELKKDGPDKAVIAANAGKMQALAARLPSWFPKGSGAEAGDKIQAKAEVWTDSAGFAAAARALQAETGKLQMAAAGGDLDAVRAQVKATGGACKACHDKYRVPEKH